jgi:hypothetical protein
LVSGAGDVRIDRRPSRSAYRVHESGAMRWPALRALSLGLALTTATGACNYDWTYTNDPRDASKDKDGSGNEDGGGTSPPKGPECTTDKPCEKGVCILRGCGNTIGNCSAECSDSVEVCACNGERVNECYAVKTGLAIDESGNACPPPIKKTFNCYTTECALETQWCWSQAGATKNECVDFKDCKPASCKCTSELPTATDCSCNLLVDGGVVVKCK